MRVLVANVYFSPSSFGGATLVCERAARGLREAGHDVLVLTSSTDSSSQPFRLVRYSALGLPVVSIRLRDHASAQDGYLDPDIGVPFGQVLEAFQPDVVHLHAIQGLSVSLAFECARRGIPFVMTLHDSWLLCERQFMVRHQGVFCGQRTIEPAVCATCVVDVAWNRDRHRLGHRVLQLADRVLAPSRYARDLWAANGVDEDRLRIHRNGVDRPRRAILPRDPGEPLVLGYVGGVGPVKGNRLIVEALNRLQRDDYVLKVVDNTGNLGFSGTHAGQWEIPGRVEILPAYDATGMDDFFESIDVLLFPSQTKESFGLTVREALVRGRWVVATDSGGSVEDIVDGSNGTVVPMDGRPEPLAAAISRLLDDPELARSRQTRPTVVDDQAEHDRQLLRILEEVVRESSGRPRTRRQDEKGCERRDEAYHDV